MSSLPYTSLVVNQNGIDTFRFNDYVYLMAPALKGGQLLDNFGNPVTDKTGQAIFVPKVLGNLADFEEEFGLASAGSDASIYASWIFANASVPIICRRVISNDLSSAYTILKNQNNDEIFWLESKTKTEFSNRILLDVSKSSLREFFIEEVNATFDSSSNLLSLGETYSDSDNLFFEGIYTPENKKFRYIFQGRKDTQEFSCFNFRPHQVADEEKQYLVLGNNVPIGDLVANQVSYDTTTSQLNFGIPPKAGLYHLLVSGADAQGERVSLAISSDGVSRSYKINFEQNTVVFGKLFANGFAKINDESYRKTMRFVSIQSELKNNNEIIIELKEGTITNTKKILISKVVSGMVEATESYDDIESFGQLILRVNDVATGSKLIRAELWDKEKVDSSLPLISPTAMTNIGFKLSVYVDGYSETYDNIRDVEELQTEINYKSSLVRGIVLKYGHNELPKLNTIGIRLRKGSSGKNPTSINYLEALYDAEKVPYATILIAPGVSDSSFHALLKNHCNEMFKRGSYRTAVVGGELNETIATKKQRGIELSHERISVIGDGLALISPITGQRQLYSPAVATAAFVGQLLSEHYYVSLTNKIIKIATGIEHEYDPAQLEELHAGKVIVFQKTKFGIQILDGITTSSINAYEDIHLVRIFDNISRNIRRLLDNSIGNSNTPTTWASVTSTARRLLEALKESDVISDFYFITQTKPQDLVDRRYRFKVAIIPTFPVKYVEGFVDIFPPYSIET